ncbi:aldo/keto reductase [Tengunoibacter tsumagoiensis]|uniref:Uncharacterized protein n=1 Tax=Tengunoibacter tsumagoiensis TaxID=2014871 RepID=A0A402A682_9CHLR|nr:aldo/keto reductase [Tengunoibacter tsumagoiensis]GCE14640.1 hypothetical protein KTT_44990 [Tengunoibacter tsumagoiensis]
MPGFTARPLGKTGMMVSPLGIGGGNGISSNDLLYAVDRGINYIFFSSDLHHFAYQRSVEAIRKLCNPRSGRRDKVILATVSYITNPERLQSVLLDQFVELGIDYIDIFHWGCLGESDQITELTAKVHNLRDNQQLKRWLWVQQQAWHDKKFVLDINQDIVDRGLVRYVGASFHSLQKARSCIDAVDVMMLRYNLLERGCEELVFPALQGEKRKDPGIVAFNVAHAAKAFQKELHTHTFTSDTRPPTAEQYRFALTNPFVDVVLTGPTKREEIDSALAAIEKGPLASDEYLHMRNQGDEYKKKYRKQPV